MEFLHVMFGMEKVQMTWFCFLFKYIFGHLILQPL